MCFIASFKFSIVIVALLYLLLIGLSMLSWWRMYRSVDVVMMKNVSQSSSSTDVSSASLPLVASAEGFQRFPLTVRVSLPTRAFRKTECKNILQSSSSNILRLPSSRIYVSVQQHSSITHIFQFIFLFLFTFLMFNPCGRKEHWKFMV
jgi:hypothetical protein